MFIGWIGVDRIFRRVLSEYCICFKGGFFCDCWWGGFFCWLEGDDLGRCFNRIVINGSLRYKWLCVIIWICSSCEWFVIIWISSDCDWVFFDDCVIREVWIWVSWFVWVYVDLKYVNLCLCWWFNERSGGCDINNE